MRTLELDSKGTSETLGVAVLVGMTLLVTAGLGVGVLFISDQDSEQTADITFSFLSDALVIVYQDPVERQAGNLYIEGPDNNVSWDALDGALGPEDMVSEGSNVRVTGDSAYGRQPGEDQQFDVVYITPEGQRFVLASVNKPEEGQGEPPTGPDDPTGPDTGGG